MRNRDKKKERKEIVESYSFVLQFGINMIVPIFACTVAGLYVGDWTGFTAAPIIGFLIGALAGYTSIYKMVRKRFKKENDEKPH